MLRIWLLLWGTLALGSAAPLALTPDDEVYNLVPHTTYYLPENVDEAAPAVTAHRSVFQSPQTRDYDFGFTRKPVWFAFEIDAAPHALAEPWILDVANPHIDHYTLYRINRDGVAQIAEGGDMWLRNREHRARTFWETLPLQSGTNAFLLRIDTGGSLQVPLRVQTLRHAYQTEAYSNLLYGIYYGVLILLLVYNLVLFLVVKENHYINYLFFLGSYLLFQLNFDGIGKTWLWEGQSWMVNEGMSFFIFMAAYFAFRFARYFLMLSRYSASIEQTVKIAEMVSMLGAVLALVLDYFISIRLAAAWMTIAPVILIYVGFVVLPTYRAARFYLAGWIVFLLSTTAVSFNKLGLFGGSNAYFIHMQQASSLLQMMLLSFALADRINMMKFDHLRKLRAFNEKLQEKIARKVDELRQKDQMMIQQSRQAAMGEMIENIAHQWRQPLNQLGLVQSGMFFDYSLGTMTEEKLAEYQKQSDTLMQYMTQTIDDFRTFFQPDREKTPFALCEAIDKTLELLKPTLTRNQIAIVRDCDDTLSAIGHENEFSQVIINIINNAKDAIVERKVAEPRLRISVSEGRDTFKIAICDNAGGIDDAIIGKIFDPYFTTKFQAQGTGIGLYMVKMIIEKSMGGRVDAYNAEQGACFAIYLPKEPVDATDDE